MENIYPNPLEIIYPCNEDYFIDNNSGIFINLTIEEGLINLDSLYQLPDMEE